MFDFFRRFFGRRLSDEALRWNTFINEIVDERDIATLTDLQKDAVICFYYDAEMCSGGHCGFFDVYEDIKPDEVIRAIGAIGTKEMVDNFVEALENGKEDDYEKCDDTYYSFEPSLCEYLEKFIEQNKEEIFR